MLSTVDKKSISKNGGREGQRGQSLVEFAMVTPLLLLLVLGVIEFGYALYEGHNVAKLAREGANLISRRTSLNDAQNAIMGAANAPPVNLGASGRLMLSVIWVNPSGEYVMTNRVSMGSLSAAQAPSAFLDPPPSEYGPAPNYDAININSSAIKITGGLPNGLTLNPGETIYVSEVYTEHAFLTPFESFWGKTFPRTLYASAVY